MSNLYQADYEIIFRGKVRVVADDANTAKDLICTMDDSTEMIDSLPYLVTAKNILKVVKEDD